MSFLYVFMSVHMISPFKCGALFTVLISSRNCLRLKFLIYTRDLRLATSFETQDIAPDADLVTDHATSVPSWITIFDDNTKFEISKKRVRHCPD